MITISQDKEIIINFDNSSYVCKDDNVAVLYARTNDGSEIEIGEYATEGRAKEVLNKIGQCYAKNAVIYEMPES